MEKREEVLKKFFNQIGIEIEATNNLDGVLITRETLLMDEKYNNIKKEELIQELKKIFSSTFLTSLQKNAEKNQRWPLLNLTRQILTQLGYNMVPHRKSDGKDATGKKKYKRFFIIQKTKIKELDKNAPIEESEKNENITETAL